MNYMIILILIVASFIGMITLIILNSKKKKSKTIDSEIAKIPEEFRCDPYETSPSGDPYFADKRNVEYVRECLEYAQKEDSIGTVLNNKEDIKRYFAKFK